MYENQIWLGWKTWIFSVSNEAKFYLPDHFFHKCDEIIDPYHVTSWFKLNIYLTTSFSFLFFSMN